MCKLHQVVTKHPDMPQVPLTAPHFAAGSPWAALSDICRVSGYV
jgi:hypothetical protein